jgi:hypothetical protein
VQVVDVLRHHEELIADGALEPGERAVRGIRDDGCHAPAPFVVEAQHEVGVGLEPLGSRDLFDAMTLPQSVRGAERGHAALGRDAGTREDDDPHGTIVT